MKAKQDFEVYIDNDGEMASEGKLVKIKKGDEVSDKLSDGVIHDIILKLPDFLDFTLDDIAKYDVNTVSHSVQGEPKPKRGKKIR